MKPTPQNKTGVEATLLTNERPWQQMEPTIKLQSLMLTAATYRIDLEEFLRWFEAYAARFSQGPDVFVPWYKQQRSRFESGLLAFEPYYPHECYAQLLEMDTGWLYDHPAWGKPA
jgi:hypothetical protein